jgi:hypothetical protein
MNKRNVIISVLLLGVLGVVLFIQNAASQEGSYCGQCGIAFYTGDDTYICQPDLNWIPPECFFCSCGLVCDPAPSVSGSRCSTPDGNPGCCREGACVELNCGQCGRVYDPGGDSPYNCEINPNAPLGSCEYCECAPQHDCILPQPQCEVKRIAPGGPCTTSDGKSGFCNDAGVCIECEQNSDCSGICEVCKGHTCTFDIRCFMENASENMCQLCFPPYGCRNIFGCVISVRHADGSLEFDDTCALLPYPEPDRLPLSTYCESELTGCEKARCVSSNIPSERVDSWCFGSVNIQVGCGYTAACVCHLGAPNGPVGCFETDPDCYPNTPATTTTTLCSCPDWCTPEGDCYCT